MVSPILPRLNSTEPPIAYGLSLRGGTTFGDMYPG